MQNGPESTCNREAIWGGTNKDSWIARFSHWEVKKPEMDCPAFSYRQLWRCAHTFRLTLTKDDAFKPKGKRGQAPAIHFFTPPLTCLQKNVGSVESVVPRRVLSILRPVTGAIAQESTPTASLSIQPGRIAIPRNSSPSPMTYPVPAGGLAEIGAANQHLVLRFFQECEIILGVLLKREGEKKQVKTMAKKTVRSLRQLWFPNGDPNSMIDCCQECTKPLKLELLIFRLSNPSWS